MIEMKRVFEQDPKKYSTEAALHVCRVNLESEIEEV